MPQTLTTDTITPTALTTILARYTHTVPPKLAALETARLHTIPAAVRARAASKPGPHVTPAELSQLVEWKLRHGTWRPGLAAQAASNDARAVQDASGRAFALLDGGAGGGDVPAALKALLALRGVGPATASLLLSVAAPDHVPFFADELFRWVHWDGVGAKPGKGWARPIGYTPKEYRSLAERVKRLRARLKEDGRETSALELEMVAYVLGKEGVDVEKPVEDDEEDEKPVAEENEKSEKAEKTAKKNTRKRKVEDGVEKAKAGKQRRTKG